PHGPRRRLDLAGAALLSAALVALLLATRHELGAAAVTKTVATAVLLLLAWAFVERRAEDPILPLTLFASAPFAATALIACASGVLLFAGVVFLPLYLQRGLGFGTLSSALHTLPLSLGITIGAQLAGRALRGGASARGVGGLATASAALAFMALA